MYCDDRAGLIEERVDRILTQYRESPNLLSLIRHDLGQIADIIIEANGSKGSPSDHSCAVQPGMPEKFDIMTAVGDQLTIVGKWLGFPRCHCVCQNVPVFGFQCSPPIGNVDIVGLCDGGAWFGCGTSGTADICFDDDEVYRGYLLARRYQARQLWDIDSLQAAASHIWGDTASVSSLGDARVAIVPGRALNQREMVEVAVAFRVLPIAPGISPYVSYSAGSVFGFGSGWGGLCEGAQWLCPQEFDPFECN